MFNACDVRITDCFEAAMRKTFDGPDQKRSPITASKDANGDWFFHNFEMIPIRRAKLAWWVNDRLHLAAPVLWAGEGLAPDDCVAPPAGIRTVVQR